jgi:hypothetical protein
MSSDDTKLSRGWLTPQQRERLKWLAAEEVFRMTPAELAELYEPEHPKQPPCQLLRA